MLGSTLRCYVGQYTGGIPVDPSLQVKLQSCTDGNVCLTGNYTLKQELGGVKLKFQQLKEFAPAEQHAAAMHFATCFKGKPLALHIAR